MKQYLTLTFLIFAASIQMLPAAFLVTIPTRSHGLYADYPPYGDFEIENLSAFGFRLGDPSSVYPHEYRSAVEFDLSSIPAGAQILEARLILDFVSGSHLIGDIDFYGYVGDGAITRQDIFESALPQGTVPSRSVNLNVTTLVANTHAAGSRYVGFTGRMTDVDATANYVTLEYWNIDPYRTRPSLLIRLSESHALPPIKLKSQIEKSFSQTLLRIDYVGIFQYSYNLIQWYDSSYNGPSPFVQSINPSSAPRLFWRVRGNSSGMDTAGALAH